MKFLKLLAAAAVGLLAVPAAAQVGGSGAVFRLAFQQVGEANSDLHRNIRAFRNNDTLPALVAAAAEFVHVVKDAHVNISREDNLGLHQTIRVMLPIFRQFKHPLRGMVEAFKDRRDIAILTRNCDTLRASIGGVHDAFNIFISLVRRKIVNAAWKTAQAEEVKMHNMMIGLKYHYHKELCQDAPSV